MKNVSQAVARVYAEALLDLAMDTNCLAQVVDDLHAVRELFDGEPTFRDFFTSPAFDRDFKKRVLKEIFSGKLGRPVLGLLHVLVDKQREMIVDNVAAEFDRYRDIREGRLHVHVSSARPLDENQKAAIRKRLEQATGSIIRIHETVVPALLGGLIVKMEDKVIDGSLRRRLERLRHTLVAAGE